MLHASGIRSDGSSILTKEAAGFSEMSVHLIQNVRHHILSNFYVLLINPVNIGYYVGNCCILCELNI
jgi:hypothetical protein